jgi:hypothetical protein
MKNNKGYIIGYLEPFQTVQQDVIDALTHLAYDNDYQLLLINGTQDLIEKDVAFARVLTEPTTFQIGLNTYSILPYDVPVGKTDYLVLGDSQISEFVPEPNESKGITTGCLSEKGYGKKQCLVVSRRRKQHLWLTFQEDKYFEYDDYRYYSNSIEEVV